METQKGVEQVIWRNPPESRIQAQGRFRDAIKRGYELSDVDFRATRIFIIGLFLSLALLAIVIGFLYGAMLPSRITAKGSRIWSGQPVPPIEIPHMELDYGLELKRVQERERNLLEKYAYIDRRAGLVRIPIDRAMDIMIDKDKNL